MRGMTKDQCPMTKRHPITRQHAGKKVAEGCETIRESGLPEFRQVLECGCPLPLFCMHTSVRTINNYEN